MVRSDVRVGEDAYGWLFPDRYVVARAPIANRVWAWGVWLGMAHLRSFDTHADAIAWAQQEARR